MSERGEQSEFTGVPFVLPSVVAAAHELKTPLVLLRQFSLQLSETTADPRTQAIHERMRLTAERSLRLVEGITKAASLENSLLESEPIELNAFLYTVADELSPLARELGHELIVQAPRRPVCMVGQREFLSALLLSLCDNALTHSLPGTHPIMISGGIRQDRVQLAVRDHGPIMTRQRFMQLTGQLGRPQAPNAHARSSGLGLWVADSFARSMESQLRVERHRTGGLTFSVALPRSHQLSLL